ncbi:MAG: putative beta-lysine N-acetyltransferase, partial [Syntrophomonas sp.]|nr:putative beta-lysine N-acetyltransferase [Syntrophomonas sp.]
MRDTLLSLGNSVIQHGKHNDRVYLMKFSGNDSPSIIDELNRIAHDNGYTKILAKVPQYVTASFIEDGFITEAWVPNFYNKEPAFFMAKYLKESRRQDIRAKECKKVLEKTQQIYAVDRVPEPDEEFCFRICNPSDAQQMAQVYKRVFATYPFPIYDHKYIIQTMNTNVVYFGMFHESKIVALASTEMDIESGNAEMTDFATLPEYTGKGLATFLLQQMELEISKRKIMTAYTI